MGGIARENKMKALAVGGTDNHAHLLLSLPPMLSVAKAIQLIKGGSSKWVHDTFPGSAGFAWQEGYGAFTIAVSGIEKTVAYINAQEEHHRIQPFEEEFIAFLRRHGIVYDARYVWG
jgi:REP element-mobilizing transposase RayT